LSAGGLIAVVKALAVSVRLGQKESEEEVLH
jgi:hypothetical protein